MEYLLSKLESVGSLNAEEIVLLLENDEITSEIFSVADEVRKKNVGDDVHLRALIEFSNICGNSCKYCGLRCENKNVERYKLSPEKIVELAENAAKDGFKTIVLQSGESKAYSVDKMQKIIRDIKNFDLAVTLSIGEKNFE